VIRDAHGTPITPELLLHAYAQRAFPMADDRTGPIDWYRPERRAIITWDRFKIPDSLRKTMRKQPYRISVDRAFPAVIAACADRRETWISTDLEALYVELHRLGHAHSVEAWRGDELVGGCYGLAVGPVFSGESMFHRADDAAKICVVHLVERLRASGFACLDCQQQSPHMRRFGAYEITDGEYERMIEGWVAEGSGERRGERGEACR
jgi:leucyl/phenylalanyl-tRNA--protein transferase